MGEGGAIAARPVGLVTRVGLALVRPEAAFAVARDQDGQAGLSDATVLLVLKVICFELRVLVLAAWTAITVGLGSGVAVLGTRVISAIGFDLAVLFGAGVAIWLGGGDRRRFARDLDLGAVAWIPMFTLEVVGGLVVAASGRAPSRLVTDGLGVLALVLTAIWVARAIRWVRREATP